MIIFNIEIHLSLTFYDIYYYIRDNVTQYA